MTTEKHTPEPETLLCMLHGAIDRVEESESKLANIIKQRDELAEALHELEPAALRLAQLMNLANKAPGASIAEWDAARQAVDKARVKARAALAKLS